MSKTIFTTDDDLTKKAWEEKLFRDTRIESYMEKFHGTSSGSLIQVKEEFTKNQGDEVTFGLVERLSDDPITGDNPLEGNEENLTSHSYKLALEQYRHGVRDAGAMTRQRAMFSIDNESREALKVRGSETIDKLQFTALQASPTKVFYKDGTAGAFSVTGTPATAKTALATANSKLDPHFISFIKAWAMTGGNRTQTPLRPVKVEGRSYYILLVHPDVMFDLKTNSTFEQALREAEVRGPTNPLFKNATAIWDNVVIHEHENIDLFTNGGSGANVPGATCAFMGAQSLVWAWGSKPEIVQETFDYKNQNGYGWNIIGKAGKPKFNSLDYGCVGVYLARTQIADA